MTTPIRFEMEPSTPDDQSVFLDQTLGGPGSFTLNGTHVTDGVWTTPDGLAHRISFESTGDMSSVAFIVTGFRDVNKNDAAAEARLGPINNTVETDEYFYSITSITASLAVGTNTQCGFVDEAISKTIPINWRRGISSVNLDISTAAPADVTVQQTFDEIQNITDRSFAWQDSPSANLVNATVSTNDAYEGLPTALRVKFNSYTVNAIVDVSVTQRDE